MVSSTIYIYNLKMTMWWKTIFFMPTMIPDNMAWIMELDCRAVVDTLFFQFDHWHIFWLTKWKWRFIDLSTIQGMTFLIQTTLVKEIYGHNWDTNGGYSGFDFPWGPGAYVPRFCCGPLDFFRLGAQNSMYNNQKSGLFLTAYFNPKTCSGP